MEVIGRSAKVVPTVLREPTKIGNRRLHVGYCIGVCWFDQTDVVDEVDGVILCVRVKCFRYFTELQVRMLA